MITPAISVLSAVEGLQIATSSLKHFVVPITLAILLVLFLFQRHGTQRIGLVFGPIMLVWFLTIGLLGVLTIVRQPVVLAAFNPLHGLRFFAQNGWIGFTVLGAVFLVVTGGEALYADLGHFGLRPIRLAWFGLVLPAFLLNYFGQGWSSPRFFSPSSRVASGSGISPSLFSSPPFFLSSIWDFSGLTS